MTPNACAFIMICPAPEQVSGYRFQAHGGSLP